LNQAVKRNALDSPKEFSDFKIDNLEKDTGPQIVETGSQILKIFQSNPFAFYEQGP